MKNTTPDKILSNPHHLWLTFEIEVKVIIRGHSLVKERYRTANSQKRN